MRTRQYFYPKPGDKHLHLTVIEVFPNVNHGSRVKCRCDCGNEVVLRTSEVFGQWKANRTCGKGCIFRHTYRHGASKLNRPVYNIWVGIKSRCSDQSDPAFHNYGGRGISVCERWLNDPLAFINDMGPRPRGASVERVDNNGNYEPGNCKWATKKEQARNTRHNRLITALGQTKTLAEWCEITGLSDSGIAFRLDSGWSAEEAITTPKQKNQYAAA